MSNNQRRLTSERYRPRSSWELDKHRRLTSKSYMAMSRWQLDNQSRLPSSREVGDRQTDRQTHAGRVSTEGTTHCADSGQPVMPGVGGGGRAMLRLGKHLSQLRQNCTELVTTEDRTSKGYWLVQTTREKRIL